MKKALDAGPVRPILLRRAGSPVRAIEWRDLFYLYAVRALREELTPKARAEFYEALQHAPIERRDEVRFGRFRIAVSDLVAEMERRTADLEALARKVEFRSDGEPLLKGTSIEVSSGAKNRLNLAPDGPSGTAVSGPDEAFPIRPSDPCGKAP